MDPVTLAGESGTKDAFGCSVAAADDGTVVVGACEEDNPDMGNDEDGSGAVYVCAALQGDGSCARVPISSGLGSDDGLGSDVAIDGDLIVAGAPGANYNALCPTGFCVDGFCCNSSCGEGDSADCLVCDAMPGKCTVPDNDMCIAETTGGSTGGSTGDSTSTTTRRTPRQRGRRRPSKRRTGRCRVRPRRRALAAPLASATADRVPR